jgi:predicted AAA+ superfamily ATPase
MIQYHRYLYNLIQKQLYKGKTILLFGARRTGKTYLIKKLIEEERGKYLNAEAQQVREQLSTTNTALLKELIGNHRLIALDEVQSIPKIGLILKVLHDTFPDVQFIATGSSSFELINATTEPLTGRSRTYTLYPLSFPELKDEEGYIEAYAQLDSILRFGLYPEVLSKSEEDKKEELGNIASNYLYKDALMMGGVKRPELINEILKLLAFQIGQEVSLNEISNKTNASIQTIQRYLYLLEQSYVITNLSSFSRNLRNEIGKSRKYYFIDLGIRNSIINNFNLLSLRNDVGQLWENFCILERMKKNEYSRRYVNRYFWRTYAQQEIDYIEEIDGKLSAFEFKWNDEKGKIPKAFAEAYPGFDYNVISKNNIMEFV